MVGSRWSKVLVATGLAAYLGLAALGGEFAITPPSFLYDLWYSAVPLIVGSVLCFAAGLFIAQWRVLPIAFVPVGVLALLQWGGHTTPFGDWSQPFTGWWETHGWWVTFWAFVFPLALGVMIRKVVAREDRLHPRPSGAS